MEIDMTIQKLPPTFQKIAHYAVLAAAICLLSITANAGSYSKKANKDIVETAASNGVIHVIDEVILPN
jgi:uncharacterized surface protein with fasciclin (FAS1) repeats